MGNLNTYKIKSNTMAVPVVRPEKVCLPMEGTDPLPVIFCKNIKSDMGVIVLQEWWGVNQQIKDEGKNIAINGNFSTMVPDLYRGKVAIDNEEAGHLMNGLDWQGAIKDIQACAKYMLRNGCKKVGVTGFCLGGALSLASVGLIEEVSAASVFYGICQDGLCDPSTIKNPVQFHFGMEDDTAGFADVASQKVLKEKLDRGKVLYEFWEYENCGHAFTNKTGPLKNYNQEQCEIAMVRMFGFFKKHLS